MELAHITPIRMLHAQPDSGVYLAISTLVLRNALYARYYRMRSDSGATVILDNPVHEDGEFTVDDTLAAAELIQPTIINIPDVIDDVDATMLQALRYAPVISHAFPQAHLMAVPHANSMKDYMACAEAMAKIPNVNYFGISLERRLNNDSQALSRRRQRVIALRNSPETTQLRIHLLGISESALELSDSLFQRSCSSADTSKFAIWALSGTPVSPPSPVRISYPGRSYFGGSDAYFDLSTMPVGLSRMMLHRNLLTWTNYAYELETPLVSLKEEK